MHPSMWLSFMWHQLCNNQSCKYTTWMRLQSLFQNHIGQGCRVSAQEWRRVLYKSVQQQLSEEGLEWVSRMRQFIGNNSKEDDCWQFSKYRTRSYILCQNKNILLSTGFPKNQVQQNKHGFVRTVHQTKQTLKSGSMPSKSFYKYMIYDDDWLIWSKNTRSYINGLVLTHNWWALF